MTLRESTGTAQALGGLCDGCRVVEAVPAASCAASTLADAAVVEMRRVGEGGGEARTMSTAKESSDLQRPLEGFSTVETEPTSPERTLTSSTLPQTRPPPRPPHPPRLIRPRCL